MSGWTQLGFSDLSGWTEDDHAAALSCFRLWAKSINTGTFVSRVAIAPSDKLIDAGKKALALDGNELSGQSARLFFEETFRPYEYSAHSTGFVTAYFEPVVEASRTQTDQFTYPIYKRPPDLIRLNETKPYPKNLPVGLQYARRTDSGLVEHFDRKQIDSGALRDRGLELYWVRSNVEAFFIHVQGSARLSLQDGTTARISFAGKTGHAYSSIGKLLVKRGVFTPQTANMENLKKWLEQDADRANEVLHHNRSYIFFTDVEGHHPDFGPIAAAGVQLTPGRSLAIDKSIHPYGMPVWLDTKQAMPFSEKRFTRLMIAQDTGSAIVGPTRGDIFIGSGDEAGMIAGSVRHDTRFVKFEAI